VHLRPRAAGLVIGALTLFVVGTNVQAGWLLVLAALLLGAALAGALLPARMVRGLTVARDAPQRAFQGDVVRVELEVTNRSRGLRASLFVRDRFVSDTEAFVAVLAPGERVDLVTERVATRRGVQGAEPVVLRSDAPFGVAERRRRIEASGVATILPRVEPLGDLDFVDLAPTAERAIHTWPRRGGGPEYVGIREYRPGDSMRHVHWPSTARHGSVMVRELEAETTRRLAIVVDTLRDVGEEWTPFDAVCSAAASVALAAAARGQGVRLVSAGADPIAGEEEILERLATLQPDGRRLVDALAATTDAVRGVETALVILADWPENAPDEIVPAIVALAAEVGRVTVLLVDAGSRGSPPASRLTETGAHELERRLAAGGVQLHRWAADRPLADAFAVATVPS
jgi:uncharacterized protein (DUF58 family)